MYWVPPPTVQEIASATDEIRRNTTPAYRSPEQVALFQGHVVNEKVDIWALGVMLFKLAFFHTPFEDVRGNVEATRILNGLGDRKVTIVIVCVLRCVDRVCLSCVWVLFVPVCLVCVVVLIVCVLCALCACLCDTLLVLRVELKSVSQCFSRV